MNDLSRYYPGGDLYEKVKAKYGLAAANNIAAAARTGDQSKVNEAYQRAIGYGAPLETSVGSIFWHDVTTDPLGAPLEGLNNQIGNALKSFFSNPWVVGATVFGIAVWALGPDGIKQVVKGSLHK